MPRVSPSSPAYTIWAWSRITPNGRRNCASVSPVCHGSCSSSRQGDRARSSMPQRAARGADSRARRRLEPPLCRPQARRRAVNRHLHYAFLKRRGHPAPSARCPDRLDIVRANRSTSHVKRSRTKTTVVSIRSASDRLETQKLDAQVDCFFRRFLGCLDSLVSPGRVIRKSPVQKDWRPRRGVGDGTAEARGEQKARQGRSRESVGTAPDTVCWRHVWSPADRAPGSIALAASGTLTGRQHR